MTGAEGAVTVTDSAGVVAVTVSDGRVTVTVVVLIGCTGAASVVVGTESVGGTGVVVVVAVVRTGTEIAGVDLVAVVRVPTADSLPPPHDVSATAVATPMAAMDA